MLKRIGYALIALTITTLGVALAQIWPNFPITGGASYCSSTVNNVCNNTVPAGPAISGNETIPADTNLSQGRQPQSVKMSLQNLGLGILQYEVPLNGVALSMTPQTRTMIINPAGTLAALQVYLVPSTMLVDNQRFGLCTTQIITALTVTAGAGTTLTGAPTAAVVPVTTGNASCPEWIYRAANTTWFRVH